MDSTLIFLECSESGQQFPDDCWRTVSPTTGRPLLARYDLERARHALGERAWESRPPGLWRFPELMPPCGDLGPVSLGEGSTPMLRAGRLGRRLGLSALWIKDEGANPTGSFKARGMSAAVTAARGRGARRLIVPTAGNAGGALAAYAARAGIPCSVAMPADTPRVNRLEIHSLATEAFEVDGHIGDAAAYLHELYAGREGVFDLSTLKEPFRLEGKKTMGYELLSDLGRLPDVVIYPAGGGTGLIGMWKAFEEMQELGWIGSERPRLVLVQAAGCAPMVEAFHSGAEGARAPLDPHTIASGLRVPAPIGDRLMLRALRSCGGTAVAVEDDEIVSSVREIGRLEGLLVCPEGGATLAALKRLREEAWVGEEDRVVLFNTGTGLKYLEVLERLRARPEPERDAG